MPLYLPGTIYDRIGDLRSNMKLSKRKLAEMIEVEPSQISRIERGETQNISNDILIKLAEVFKVSTDYLLGLTTVSVPKSYEISEFGLSEGAIKALVMDKVDVKTLKLGDHDAEIEKIKNNFMIILRDIKKSMASGEMPAEPVTADMMQKIWGQLKGKPREEITADDVADAMVLAVGEADVLGEKGLELFRQLAGLMLAGE